MKFYCKYNNFRILLTPNVPGNPYMQIPPVHGKSVKFTYGVAEVEDEDVIALMKAHKQFGKDFFAEEADPFKGKRTSSEPVHDLMDLEGGRPGKAVSSTKGPVDTKKIEELVKKMAIQLLEEGGYAKVDEYGQVAAEPFTPQNAASDDEPMDTALSDNGEIPQEDAPKENVVPPAIETDSALPEDDGINPLASTLPEEMQENSSEEKSSVEEKSEKKTKKKAKK